MPKTKSSSSVRTKSKLDLKVVLFTIVGVAFLIATYLYSTMQKSSINEIRELEAGVGMPQPTFIPSSTPTPKCATVMNFSVTGNCGNTSYQTMTFTCGSSTRLQRQGGAGSCKPYSLWYSYAQSTCLATCPRPSTTPTPKPSTTPTPNPSLTPTPFPSTSPNSSVPPTPRACMVEYGSCTSTKSPCLSYNNSCTKEDLCSKPYTSCVQATTYPSQTDFPISVPSPISIPY